MQTLALKFTMDKVTKGTYRYKEVSDLSRGVVGTIYILKSAIDGEPPTNIEVEIREKKAE